MQVPHVLTHVTDNKYNFFPDQVLLQCKVSKEHVPASEVSPDLVLP